MPENTTQVVRPDTASHWYLVDPEKGVESFHTVPYAGKRGKNGETRKTTLRDARKVGAFPSVTNVLGILHKDFLEAYKINQAILAALTLPKIDGESEDDFAKRVVTDSKEHAASAARLGGRLHEVGADLLKGKSLEESIEEGEIVEGRKLAEVAIPLRDLLARIQPKGMHTDEEFSEFYVAHPLGYAGTCDGFIWLDPECEEVNVKLRDAGYGHLIEQNDAAVRLQPLIAMADIKSRGADTMKPLTYETDLLQLGAYLHAVPTTPGLGFAMDPLNTPVANILVNTHKDAGKDGRWDAEVVIHSRDELESAWKAFQHALALWCWVKNYNPNENGGAK